MAVLSTIPSTNLRWCDLRDTLNAHGGRVTNRFQDAFSDESITYNSPVPACNYAQASVSGDTITMTLPTGTTIANNALVHTSFTEVVIYESGTTVLAVKDAADTTLASGTITAPSDESFSEYCYYSFIWSATTQTWTLCGVRDKTYKPDAKINRWSAHKPYAYNSLTPPTDSVIFSNKYGLTPNTPTITRASRTITNLVNWAYTKPDGSSTQPFRIGDYKGYNPSAVAPFTPPSEVLWNQASGDDFPPIPVPFRLDDSGGRGTQTNREIGLRAFTEMYNATKKDMRVAMIGFNDIPSGSADARLYCAIALDSMLNTSGADADAMNVYPKYFSMWAWLTHAVSYLDPTITYDNIPESTDYQTSGFKHTLYPVICDMAQSSRGRNYPYHDSSKTVQQFNTNLDADTYNGFGGLAADGVTFYNAPGGPHSIDVYSYWLASWMYGLVGGITIRDWKFDHSSELTYKVGENHVSNAYMAQMNSLKTPSESILAWHGYTEIEFTLRICNDGATIKIGDKVISSTDTPAAKTISFIEGSSTSHSTFSIFTDSTSGTSAFNCHLPKLLCWYCSDRNMYAYTAVAQSYLMTHSAAQTEYGALHENVNTCAFDANGTFLAYITAITSTTITLSNGYTYSQHTAGNITNVSKINGREYGMRGSGSSGFSTTYQLVANQTVDITFRFLADTRYPSWPVTGSALKDLMYAFMYNSGAVNRYDESETPIQNPIQVGTGVDTLDGTCATAASASAKVVNCTNGAIAFGYIDELCLFEQGEYQLVVNFTYANTASSATLHVGYSSKGVSNPSAITAGLNYFYFDRNLDNGNGMWVRI